MSAVKKPGVHFCIQPWTNLFLHNSGRIQPCCMNSTCLGSVYSDNLAEVWNNEKLQFIRQNIIEHDYVSAGCKPGCPIGFQISQGNNITGKNPKWLLAASSNSIFKENYNAFLESVENHLLHARNKPMDIDIQSTESCNMQCIMCHQHHGKKGHIPAETISRFLTWTECIQTIRFQGGEIFIDPDFSLFLCQLKESCKTFQEIHVITNGTMIKVVDLLRMTSAPNPIRFIVSIDAISADVYRYIRRSTLYAKAWDTLNFLASRQKELSRKDIVQWNFVVMKSNFHQLKDAIRIASDLDIILHLQPIIGPYTEENIFDYPQIRPPGSLETIRECMELSSYLKSQTTNLPTIEKKLSQ